MLQLMVVKELTNCRQEREGDCLYVGNLTVDCQQMESRFEMQVTQTVGEANPFAAMHTPTEA